MVTIGIFVLIALHLTFGGASNPSQWRDPLIPLAQADELAVDILAEDHPKSDCYIDDIFTAFLETDVKRGSRICPIYSTLAGSPTIA